MPRRARSWPSRWGSASNAAAASSPPDINRTSRDGRALIEPVQLLAGDRLRAEFARAQLKPRTTSNWSAPVADGPRGASPAAFSDSVIGAPECVRHALDAVGPEFSGLLVDVCCFLKSIADVERERGWPARSGKVVLQLGTRPSHQALRPRPAGTRQIYRSGADLARRRCRVCRRAIRIG
jgi:hypothetical protein